MRMKPILFIDFGSTNTKVTAVDLDEEIILGTAASYTTVETDINEGLEEALTKLIAKTGPLDFVGRYACSSAAGGLKMLASGLVPELTVKAAKEAALGAGAKVLKVYSYELTEDDLAEIEETSPDIFLLTGGTDGGNKEVITANAARLATVNADFPVLVAGNRAAARTCEKILADAGKEVYVCDNVMPKLGELNVGPAQKKIREIFLEKIVSAKGLDRAGKTIDGIMMPTPAAVLGAMEILAEGIGDLIGIDVGGATTDVYSMSEGAPERTNTVIKGLTEPFAKRTVEGDIGMRYSAMGIVEAAGTPALEKATGLDGDKLWELLEYVTENTSVLPEDEALQKLDFGLASLAVRIGVARHAGTAEKVYTPLGEAFMQQGKDLTRVKKIVVTGGSLIHNEKVKEIAANALYDISEPTSLRPTEAEILVDKRYILSAMGLLGQYEPEKALRIMRKELVSYGTCKQEIKQ